jgi:hypothetical protein
VLKRRFDRQDAKDARIKKGQIPEVFTWRPWRPGGALLFLDRTSTTLH